MNLHQARYFANLSILTFFIFASIMISLHILSPEFDSLNRTMSEYVSGQYGGLMVTAFMVLAIGVATVTLALYNALDSSLRSRLIFFILAQASIGFFVAGLFPTDLIDEEVTLIGNIHIASSFMGILGIPIALVLILRKLKYVEKWQRYYQTAFAIGIATLIWFFIWKPFLDIANMDGLGQRVFACFLLAWLLYTCFYIRKLGE